MMVPAWGGAAVAVAAVAVGGEPWALPSGGGEKPEQAAVFHHFQVFRQRLFVGGRLLGTEKATHVHHFYPPLLVHHDVVPVEVIGDDSPGVTVFHGFLDLIVQTALQLFAPLKGLPQGGTVYFV